MLELSAQTNSQIHRSVAVRCGAVRDAGAWSGRVAHCGGEVFPTAGLLTESGRSHIPHDGPKMQGLLLVWGLRSASARREQDFTEETDYLGGNHSRICPGGSGH